MDNEERTRPPDHRQDHQTTNKTTRPQTRPPDHRQDHQTTDKIDNEETTIPPDYREDVQRSPVPLRLVPARIDTRSRGLSVLEVPEVSGSTVGSTRVISTKVTTVIGHLAGEADKAATALSWLSKRSRYNARQLGSLWESDLKPQQRSLASH